MAKPKFQGKAVSEKKDIFLHNQFSKKFGDLKYFREIIRDGNCLYISLSVQIITFARENSSFSSEWISFTDRVKNYLTNLNIDEVVYINNIEAFNDIINSDEKLEDVCLERWYEIIYLIRLAISAQMRINSELYQPYIPDMTVETYCKKFIEPFYIEAGYLEICALVEILPLSIEVIDIQENNENCSRLYGMYEQKITILHTPNHFEPVYYK